MMTLECGLCGKIAWRYIECEKVFRCTRCGVWSRFENMAYRFTRLYNIGEERRNG